MKVFAASTLLATGALAAHPAVAAEPADRPAGVEERNWIVISDRLGFVVDEQRAIPSAIGSRQILLAPPESVSAELMPPAKGYFVVKTQTGWRRVVIAAPSEFAG